MKTLVISVLLFTLQLTIHSQPESPDEILKRVAEEFEKVKDYEVDVTVSVDVKFIKMPDRKAKIFYKYPDKIFVESEGFALLPKQGLNYSPSTFINSPHSALFDREEILNGVKTTVIKVIPLGNNSDVILSTLWIDTERNLIMKIDSSTKPDGSVIIEFQYLKTDEKYFLPSTMIFTFDIDKVRFPAGVTGEIENDVKKGTDDEKKQNTGKVTIDYSNYKVNQGLRDEIFKNQDKGQENKK